MEFLSAEKMVYLVSILAVSLCDISGNDSCRPWFEYDDTASMCLCSPSIEGYISCSQLTNESSLHFGMMIGYKRQHPTEALVANIPYIYPSEVVNTTDLDIKLTNTSLHKQRAFLCDKLKRKHREPSNKKSRDYYMFCGRCQTHYGPAIYSFGLQCAKCHYATAVLKYFGLQILPITIFYGAVLIFKIDLTRPNMFHYIVFCNTITIIFRYSAALSMNYLYSSKTVTLSTMMKVGLTLSGVWSLDFFRFVVPPFCFSTSLHDCMVPFFDFFPAVYLILLTVVIAGFIKLYSYKIKLILALWRPFQYILTYFKLTRDPVEAVVHTYATFFFLYFTKTVSVAFLTALTSAAFSQNSTKHIDNTLTVFYDPTAKYFEEKHIKILMIVFVIAAILILPAVGLLIFFRTSLFQGFYHAKVNRQWQTILRIFVQTLENGYKDGTHGNPDYRPVAGGLLLALILASGVVMLLLRTLKHSDNIPILFTCFSFAVVTVAYGSLRPYKKRSANNMAVCMYGMLVIITNLMTFILQRSPEFYRNQRLFLLFLVMLLILIVNMVYTVYITQKIMAYFISREQAMKWWRRFRRICVCLYCCAKDEEQQGLLSNPGPQGYQ